MAVDIYIKTDNSEATKRALNSAIEKALEAVGLVAERYAAEMSPVDTGRLRASITHSTDTENTCVYIGTNVEYAIYQEVGTSKMSAANGGQGYLRPAISRHIDEYKELIKSYMSQA